MENFHVLLESFVSENLFSFGVVLVLTLLFVIYKYRAQDDVGFGPNNIGLGQTQCERPDCVRCRAAAKERMYVEIHRRMEHILSDAGELQLSQSGISDRLRHSFEQQLRSTVKPKMNIEDECYMKLQNPSMFYLQQLSSNHVFHDFKNFPNYVKLAYVMKSYIKDVRGEFDNVWSDFLEGKNMDGWQENTLAKGKWYTLHLINQGKKQSCNMERCPKTLKMLNTVEPLMTNCMFGFATFSVVMPGTHIESHCGATNVRLRCHLGLHIPEDCCSLTVNGEVLHWKENELLVFDDSFLHEAEHNGTINEHSYPRSVLMLDVWHPCLSSEEKDILNYVFHSDVVHG